MSLQKRAVVAAFQFADLLFDGLKMHRHFVEALDTITRRFFVLKGTERGMNFHELKRDVFGGFADLSNGGRAVHEVKVDKLISSNESRANLSNEVAEVFQFHGEIDIVDDDVFGNFDDDG